MEKLKLRLYSTGRWAECSTEKCRDRNTYIIHRGGLGFHPMFLCEDCIREIAEQYVMHVGADKARMTFAGLMQMLVPEKAKQEEAKVEAEEARVETEPKKRAVRRNG